MRRLLFASSVSASVLVLSAAAAFVGCANEGADDSESATANIDSAEDVQLARSAVKSIAGANARCTACHTASRDDIRRWGESMKKIEDTCLSPDLTLTAAERIACLREEPAVEASGYSATKLGLYAAGVGLPEMEALFTQAYPSAAAEKYAEIKSQAAMPVGSMPAISAADFATIKKWVLKGMPALETVMTEPGAFPCVQNITPAMTAHIATMKTEGWTAKFAETSTPMARCGAATDAKECLKSLDDLTAQWGAPGTVQTLRQLRKMNQRSSYWTRSSADGRFAALGGSPSRIVDLNAPEDDAPIKVSAPYDPGFFPNNDGFSFAGTQAGGLRVCRQSVLLNALASANRQITFSEPGCTQIINTVYQSIGASLDGSLFFMATGSHTNDPGGASGPLSASFGENSTTTLTPMFNDGTRYVPGRNVAVKIPYEGDQQMSPSNTLLITRFGQKAGTSGYRIRAIKATITPAGSGTTNTSSNGTTEAATPSVEVESTEIATVCMAGGKPQMSYNERFIAVHQYTDAQANPSGLPAGTSNIFVMDLKTGKTLQVTKMASGQQALYPHFRADGWLYFLVRESGKETLVASDVALHQPE